MTPKKQLTALVTVTLGGTATFASLCIWNGNESFFSDYVMPFTRRLDPETSHKLAVFAMKHCLIKKQVKPDPESIATRLWGMNFSNPIGLAAGFDKQAEAMQGLHRTGFGFVEIGSVTPEPQDGNKKPRVFRLDEDKAIINRYGFNSEGHEAVYSRVKMEGEKPERAVIGVNLGKNKLSAMEDVGDYVDGVKKFGAIADYLVINVSSPNTAGLRGLQQKKELENLISCVLEARNNLGVTKLPPLLLKIAPDLNEEERKDIANVILKDHCRVDGIIVCNTTTSRPSDLKSEFKDQTGGLSGQPLKDISTRCIGDFYRLTGGQIPIIGVGGVATGQDAFEKILAGASLVQLYTSFAFQGPPIVRRIKRELDEILRSKGYKNISEAIGKSALSS
uniref:Dihydroorotate dehydrogenase (quinone), mitochondrial n=1 Tax=Daphnia pulicaria TaxID=35523 RepID=A0A4Y7MY80_9CRUS|nr:EOG090X08P9 [Daphnia pulicaria]